MKNDFLSRPQLLELGFATLGRGVQISRHAVILSADRIRVGNFARVDAFCVLAAGRPGITIGEHVHVSAHSTVLGPDTVEIEDFATISVRCSIFSSSDDFSGRSMTNPTVPSRFRKPYSAPVRIRMHALLGAGSIVLPGVTVGESAAVGALSLVKEDVPAFAIVAGVPARVVSTRSEGHRELATRFLRERVS